MRHRWKTILLASALLSGCSRPPAPSNSSSEHKDAMPAASRAWTREQAAKNLNDPNEAVPAAVRLVRLSDVRALCVASDLTPELAAHLQVLPLREKQFALGFKQGSTGRRLVAPVILDDTGGVVAPVPWERQEQAVLILSENVEIFPHVIVLPREVFLLRNDPLRAIVAKSIGKGHFEALNERRGPSVAIVVEIPAASPGERPRRKVAARYRWDLAEQMFVGPGADNYPDPPGGGFEMDLESSGALLAVGGIINEPELPEPESQPDEPMPY